MEKIIHISAGTEYSCSTPIANSGEDGYMQYSFSKSELAIYADVFFDISFDAAIILNEYISKFSKDCDVDDWVKVGDSAPNFNFQESSSETMSSSTNRASSADICSFSSSNLICSKPFSIRESKFNSFSTKLRT